MKKTLITTLLLVAAVGAFAQGQLNFGNQFGSTILMPIYNVDPANPLHVVTGNSAQSKPAGATVYAGGLLNGPGFTMALFAGAQGTASDQLRLAASAPLRSSATGALPAGLIVSMLGLQIDGVAPGGIAQLEIRAWDNRGGTVDTWAKVQADPTVARGTSGTFLSGALGGVGPDGPILAPNTTGWQSFGLFVVPEPSTIALAVLGLGSVLLFRRRK